MNKIQAVLALPRPLPQKESDALTALLQSQGIELEVAGYTPLSYHSFDVAVVHEEMIKNGTSPPGVRNLIVLFDAKSSPNTVYQKARANAAAAALEFPFGAYRLTSLIQEVYQEGLRQKSAEAAQIREGKTIAVSSFKPGVGKSVIAYNLAAGLGHFVDPTSIVLVDLNEPLPASRALLDMDPEVGWDTIAPLLADGQIIDRGKLRSVTRTTPYGFQLLSRNTSSADEASLTPGELEVLLTSQKAHSPLTIFDMPSSPTLASNQRLEGFDQVVFIATPASACVANLSRAIPYIREHHETLFKRSIFVLNQYERRHEKMKKVLEERLDVQIFCTLIDDPQAVETFTSQGKLFDDKSLIITRDLAQLAHDLFKKVF